MLLNSFIQRDMKTNIRSRAQFNKYSRPVNVVNFRPVCNYANFEDLIEEVISVDDSTGENTPEVLVKHALVAVEGSFKDSDGRPHDFSEDRLSTIAEHTNKALETGVVIPVCTDHKKEFNSTVGGLGDKAAAYTKVIEEGDLPNSRAKHLLGKVGLFLDDVVIKARHAIDQVKQGVVTSVSMGLNLDPKDHRIVELSLVPIPAIPNMGLFALGGDTVGEDIVFTWEDLETSEETLDDLKEEYIELTEKLWKLLDNIYTSESAEITDLSSLKQYVYTALNGFSVRVLDVLGLTDVPDTPDPSQDAAAMGADQQAAMQQTMSQDTASPGQQQAVYNRGRKGLLEFAKYNKMLKYF